MNLRKEINMMTEVVEYLKEEGFTREFRVGPKGVEDPKTHRLYRPENLSVQRIYRFEGEGKLPRLDVLYALQADDGTRGWIAGASDEYPVKQISALISKMRGMATTA